MLRSPLGATALVLLALVVLTAVVAPLLWGAQADVKDTGDLLAGPSAEHPVGTDNLGRDLLLRTLVATRLSVALALLATAVAVTAGLILGVAPLLLGRVLGRAVTWFTGIAVAFPGLLLALFFAAIFGSTATAAVFAIGLAGAPSFARLCQNLIAGIEARDFISAARVGGVGYGCSCATCCRTSANRSSSTPPWARAGHCSPSPGSRSSASACNRPSTTGDA